MSNDSKVASSGSDREDCLIAGYCAGSSLRVATESTCVRVWFILLRGRFPRLVAELYVPQGYPNCWRDGPATRPLIPAEQQEWCQSVKKQFKAVKITSMCLVMILRHEVNNVMVCSSMISCMVKTAPKKHFGLSIQSPSAILK